MQMSRLHETAAALIYDPIGPNRIATRASLHSVGFRRVDLAPSLDVLRERLRLRSPDLLLVEVAGRGDEGFSFVEGRALRALGGNPLIWLICFTSGRHGS